MHCKCDDDIDVIVKHKLFTCFYENADFETHYLNLLHEYPLSFDFLNCLSPLSPPPCVKKEVIITPQHACV
jgi:hypothetical protein